METTMDNLTMGGLIMGGAFVMNSILAIYHYETESDKMKFSISVALICLIISFSLFTQSELVSPRSLKFFAITFVSVVFMGMSRIVSMTWLIVVLSLSYVCFCSTIFM